MGDVDDGDPERAVQLEQLGTQVAALSRVEVCERLVVEKHVGLAHDCPSQGHPLPLSARERAGPALEHSREAESLGGLLHAARDLGRGDAADLEAERDVAPCREVGIEGVALKHHGDVALARGQLRDVAVADADLARARGFQSGDAAQHGRFAASRRPQQHEELAVVHVE